MISTLFGSDALSSGAAFLLSLLIGAAFGVALERAGFGSSRRLAGIFYLRDMTVLKVMFTAMVTAMLGLNLAQSIGLVNQDQLFLMPTVYGPQIVGGLIFGVGFAVGAWCPGTAAVGVASGRIDALLFLGGSLVGAILFNEMFSIVAPLYNWGHAGVKFLWNALGMSANIFALLFTGIAIACFWGAEWVEKRVAGRSTFLGSPFLKTFSVALLIVAVGVSILPAGPGASAAATGTAATEAAILSGMEAGDDHLEPEELAERLLAGDSTLQLIDIRTPEEYATFHLPGAVNVAAADLAAHLAPRRNVGTVVLYSNGMTHPAQARDALARLGHNNVLILTDGLDGFLNRCLKPVSLRPSPVPPDQARRIAAWRRFFLSMPETPPVAAPSDGPALPGLVETAWLMENLRRDDLRIIDMREAPAYNGGHIPGSVWMSPEQFRGVVGGVSARLLPADMIARQLSLLGITPRTTVVIAPSAKVHDATLVSLALQRVGHTRHALLNGGFERWVAEKRPVDTLLPAIVPTNYAPMPGADNFSLDYNAVLDHATRKTAVLIDVRPADFFTGKKSDEARAGRIPGARNRPHTADIAVANGVTAFKPLAELHAAYAALIPSRDSTVVVSCRTGHQASQAFFVLRHLLGYRNVHWYDGGWAEWASRPELPVQTGP